MRTEITMGLAAAVLLALLPACTANRAAQAPGTATKTRELAAPVADRAARPHPRKAQPRAAPTQEKTAMAHANNGFGCDLYTALRSGDENLFFSPASLMLGLAMTRLGAAGETAAEFDALLHLDQGDAAAPGLGELQRAWLDDTGGARLEVANRLFGEQTYRFRSSFLEATREHFAAELEALDFARNPDAARRRINDWVAEQTADKIQDLIPDGAVDPSTALVLANAIYFLADWREAFDPDLTQPRPFTLVGGDQIEVPMMRSRPLTRLYAELPTFQLLALPYEGEQLDFVALLPNQGVGLAALEQELDATQLAAWFDAAGRQEVSVSLPSFKMETEFNLNQVLAKLGLRRAFSAREADFTGMSERRDLFITAVVHKAYIDLNEQGTEAAAASGIVMGKTSVGPRPKFFTADRPFLFLIRHRETGAVLFLGRVMDPR